MKLKVGYRERDTGAAKLKQNIAKLKAKPRVKVGVVGKKASEQRRGVPIAVIAAVHEFGSPQNNIPERSFLRPTLDANQREIFSAMGKGFGAILDGKATPEAVLSRIGEAQANEVKARVQAGISPPLQKGSRTPLIDTGALLDSIGYEVAK